MSIFSVLNILDLSKRRSKTYENVFSLKLYFFRTRHKVLLESMLEQIFSTVILVRIKLSDRLFGRTICQKNMTIFVLFLKQSQRVHSTILHPNFKAIVILKISFREKGYLKNPSVRHIILTKNNKISVTEH